MQNTKKSKIFIYFFNLNLFEILYSDIIYTYVKEINAVIN